MVDREPWHLDKRVPIALIFTVLMQTLVAVWWAAALSSSVESITNRVEFIVSGDRRQWDAITSKNEKINELSRLNARIEGILETIVAQNARILDRIDKHQNSHGHSR